jgi:hypothetical protein
MKSVCHRGIWDEDDEDVVSSPKQKKLYDRNTPKNAFDYVNKYLLLGAIEHVPHAYANENAICELLYDLSTFPLPSVLDKLRQNGFIIL